MPRRRRSNRGGFRPENPGGRPRLAYAQMELRTRNAHTKIAYRHIKQIREPYEIIRDAFVRLTRRRLGPNAANLVADCTSSESRAKKIQKVLDQEPTKFAPKQALAMLLHLKLSQYQYSQIAKLVHGISKNVILPAYDFVRRYKANCRPAEGIQVTEVKGEVDLENLLTHTLDRLYEANMESIETKSVSTTGRVTGFFKLSWGFDSATGQRLWKQAFQLPENRDRTDNSLFAAVFNPLELVLEDGSVLWKNNFPQSPLLVRTFFLEFAKETTDYVLTFNNSMEDIINHLQPLELVLLSGTTIEFKPILYLTMVDGKVFNILTGTGSANCPVCRAGRYDFNVLGNIGSDRFGAKNNGLKHGANGQHGWIRVLQHLLNVASNLPVYRERATGEEATELRNARKSEIQAALFRLGLIVSTPGYIGQGNTLDGNTSRRALRNYGTLAQILDIDEDLIRRLWIVLVCVNNTKYKLNADRYQEYAIETYQLYVRLYSFYPMSPSVHKLLIHAVEIQNHLQHPLGVLSESSGELWHRIRKQIRRDSTRKISRQATMEDLLNRCLDLSDPVVSEIARDWIAHFRERKLALPEEAIRLLNVVEEDGVTTNNNNNTAQVVENNNPAGNANEPDDLTDDSSSGGESSDDESSPSPKKQQRSEVVESEDDEPMNLTQHDAQIDEENGPAEVIAELWEDQEGQEDEDVEYEEEEYLYEYNEGD